MKITITSVFVDDQANALKFYTEKLGFLMKTDIPLGEFRWLTVVSPDDPDGVELLLEPNQHPAAQKYQKAIFHDGIPAATFAVAEIQTEYLRLQSLDVRFTLEPTDTGDAMVAIFDDTCGNLIQIHQKN